MAREPFQTLTEPMYYILLALTRECCGVDVMAQVQAISAGRVNVGPGTVYAMLSRFEEGQIVLVTRQEGRKKWYRITERGMEMLRQEYERLEQMLADGRALFN